MLDRVQFDGANGSIAYDARHLPVLFIRFLGHIDVDVLARGNVWQAQHVAELERSNLRVAWIADVRHAEMPTPEVRRVLAERWRVNSAHYRSWVIAEYAVVDNAVIRGLFTLLRMINPSLHVDIYGSIAGAARRARAVLGDAGIASDELSASQIDDLFRP